jgi:uncharacterized protein (DUF2252 family)
MDNGRAGRERSVAAGKASRDRVPLESREIVANPPLIVPVEELAADANYGMLRSLVGDYARTLPADRRHLLSRFRLTQVARKVVGVGSVGTQAWILLMEAQDDLDPLLLQAKQAERSVLAAYAGESQQAVADFGESYADQTERDHAALAEAVASGRAEVTRGV